MWLGTLKMSELTKTSKSLLYSSPSTIVTMDSVTFFSTSSFTYHLLHHSLASTSNSNLVLFLFYSNSLYSSQFCLISSIHSITFLFFNVAGNLKKCLWTPYNLYSKFLLIVIIYLKLLLWILFRFLCSFYLFLASMYDQKP